MPHSFMGKVQFDADLLTNDDRFQWEQSVAATLNKVWESYTGRNLLDVMGQSHKIVKIVPFYKDKVNASAKARSPKDAYYPERPLRRADNGHLYAGSGTGTGRGSDVRLNFTPWRYPRTVAPSKLIHEMTHAAEMQRGVIFMNTVHSACFDTVAEFDAIVVENIYRSETHLSGENLFIRKDHHGTHPLHGNRMLPQEGELGARLDSFRARMPQLTQALAQVRVAFNPLRPGNPAYGAGR